MPRGSGAGSRPRGRALIRLSWFHPILIFMAFFCVFWDGFIIVWYTMALAGPIKGNMMWLPLLFPLMHVAVGVGLTYYVIAGFLNSTRILIDHESVHIRHQPLPWRGNRDQPRSDIRSIEMTMGWAKNHQACLRLLKRSRRSADRAALEHHLQPRPLHCTTAGRFPQCRLYRLRADDCFRCRGGCEDGGRVRVAARVEGEGR